MQRKLYLFILPYRPMMALDLPLYQALLEKQRKGAWQDALRADPFCVTQIRHWLGASFIPRWEKEVDLAPYNLMSLLQKED